MSTADGPELRIHRTPQDAAQDCSQYILSLLSEILKLQDKVSIALSGGSTPKLLFAQMAKAHFEWSKVHFFFVDERCVPPESEQSNFKLANDGLFVPAKIADTNIHRIHGELLPADGAHHYVGEIRTFFKLSDGQLPVFDILHRGMGPDAHTASLFPGTPLVNDRSGTAASVWVEKMKMDRVTLLPGVLLAAKRTVLLVAGDDKSDALPHVLEGPEDFTEYPCQIASRDSRAVWFLDKAAAAKL